MAVTNLILQLGEIPSEGKSLQGVLAPSIFDLKDQLAKPLSGIRYDLLASVVDGFVVLQGSLEADFELLCGHTNEPFPYEVRLKPYLESVPIENEAFLDLTDQLREDILLALPAYPKAPGADAETEFPTASSEKAAETNEDRPSAWDALDGLKTSD